MGNVQAQDRPQSFRRPHHAESAVAVRDAGHWAGVRYQEPGRSADGAWPCAAHTTSSFPSQPEPVRCTVYLMTAMPSLHVHGPGEEHARARAAPLSNVAHAAAKQPAACVRSEVPADRGDIDTVTSGHQRAATTKRGLPLPGSLCPSVHPISSPFPAQAHTHTRTSTYAHTTAAFAERRSIQAGPHFNPLNLRRPLLQLRVECQQDDIAAENKGLPCTTVQVRAILLHTSTGQHSTAIGPGRVGDERERVHALCPIPSRSAPCAHSNVRHRPHPR